MTLVVDAETLRYLPTIALKSRFVISLLVQMQQRDRKSMVLRERVHSFGDENRPESSSMIKRQSWFSRRTAATTPIAKNNDNHKRLQKSNSLSSGGESFPLSKAIQDIRIKWGVSSACTKVTITILAVVAISQITFSLLDLMYHGRIPLSIQQKPRNDSFAVVINTFRRPQMLKEAVQHYGETCGRRMGVGQVFIVWADLKNKPPSSTDTLFGPVDRIRARKHRSPVTILKAPKDSLNSRFLPIRQLKHDAVFMVDDDVRVDCQSLWRGFQAWEAYPQSMVGYYPRLAAVKPDKKSYIYQAWPIVWWRQKMNFVLTKASFFHSKYLTLYSDPRIHPTEILDYVDKRMNCEDVAMALVVANATKQPQIYVEGSISDKGLFNGISTKTSGTEHMDARSKCLDDLTQIYEKHGWARPLDKAFPLRKASWVKHFSKWQYRPSNIFEWGALENIFK